MTEPTRIGLAAESAALTRLANSIEPAGTYKIFRGSFDQAADPVIRAQPPEWFVQDATMALVFSSTSSDDVRAFLTSQGAQPGVTPREPAP